MKTAANRPFAAKSPQTRASGMFFTPGDGSEREFRFDVPGPQYERMVPGVPYTLHPRNEHSDYTWAVGEGVVLVAPGGGSR